jgi:queuine tRNA-ribosyltransferase
VVTARLIIEHVDGSARTAVVETPRGKFTTPCFMPVGTRGAVRLLDAGDLDGLGPQVVLANAYHLMLRPGADVVRSLGGLHRFTGWSGHLLTDSGGFQVFSLNPRVDDEGVTFRSVYDGSSHRLTPEEAVAVQAALGADIQMVLDICTGLPAPDDEIRRAGVRTLAWAARARAVHQDGQQSLFGIVQGGVNPDLRAEFARATAALDFDGYGIGGLSVGESREQLLAALTATVAELPVDRPRYLMGVGDPVTLLDAIGIGVDMFDCVLPTRLARHGTALSTAGRFQVRAARHATDSQPLDPDCGCRVCDRFSRGYVRHLLVTSEPTGGRLLSIHNLSWLLAVVDRARTAIRSGTLGALRADIAAIWKPGSLR